MTVSLEAPLALVFPGQGVQAPGMGRSLYERYPAAARVFERAESLLQMPIRRLCFEGPADELNRTEFLQPAVTTVSWAAFEIWRELYPSTDISVVAGHSLGEVAALAAAGSISWESAVCLVKERGLIMARAAAEHGGGMIAIVGLDEPGVEAVRIKASAAGPLWIANRNSVEQFVLSGNLAAIHAAEKIALEDGARRALILTISLPAHTPLMEAAAAEFRQYVDELDMHPAHIPLLGNASGCALRTVAELRDELAQQMLRQVDWTETMVSMQGLGVRTVVELGPGRVLASLATKHIEGIQSWNADELFVQFADQSPEAVTSR